MPCLPPGLQTVSCEPGTTGRHLPWLQRKCHLQNESNRYTKSKLRGKASEPAINIWINYLDDIGTQVLQDLLNIGHFINNKSHIHNITVSLIRKNLNAKLMVSN
jgi:hypothetical protein